ncbi:MAG: MarR family winged helix-turn-helix transcriptional regulator [Draconibacterium sp.]
MDDKLQLQSQVCFPIYSLSREIINRYRPFLDELEITYPQYLVLMVLWESGIQTVNQIGEKLNLDSGTLTPLLKRMEAKGLVHRTRKRSDERVVEITLSDEGKKLKERAKFVPEKLMASIDLTAEELDELRRVVTKILEKTR